MGAVVFFIGDRFQVIHRGQHEAFQPHTAPNKGHFDGIFTLLQGKQVRGGIRRGGILDPDGAHGRIRDLSRSILIARPIRLEGSSVHIVRIVLPMPAEGNGLHPFKWQRTVQAQDAFDGVDAALRRRVFQPDAVQRGLHLPDELTCVPDEKGAVIRRTAFHGLCGLRGQLMPVRRQGQIQIGAVLLIGRGGRSRRAGGDGFFFGAGRHGGHGHRQGQTR